MNTDLPQRISLVSQVADILRRDLRQKRWTDFLPGENALCGLLQVSRPTIRSALATLRNEGWIEIAKGRRARVVARTSARPAMPSKVVGFLSGLDWEEMESYTLFRIGELRHHLQDAGYKLEVHADPRLDRRRPFKGLERIVHELRSCCWLLHLTNHSVQAWFQEQRLRAIVLGSPQPDIHFPSIDRHYQAIVRHAVGVVLGQGHRRVTLLLRDTREGGDLATELGFSEAFENAGHPDALPRIARHDATVEGIRSLLNTLLRARPRPTALLVRNPGAVLTVMSHLMHSGIRVPQEISVVGLDDERYLNHLSPAPARYRQDWNAYAAKLSRMVIQLATSGTLAQRRTLVMPQFEKGETVAPV